MAVPEQLNDFLKRNLCGVEVDLQSFRVIPQAVIFRKLLLATGIADPSAVDAFQNPKLGIGTPESAKGKSRSLKVVRNCEVNLRDRNQRVRILRCLVDSP